MSKRVGTQTVAFYNPPYVKSYAAIAGPKEAEGPMASCFDALIDDEYLGQDSFEAAESMLLKNTIELAFKKANINTQDSNYIISGDLLNQCVSSAYCIRDLSAPYIGIYGACSTMAEGLMLSAMLVDGEFADVCANATSSHFCCAERQYRFPLEYGSLRTPTSQWTVTGSGCVILTRDQNIIKVTHATAGKIIDMGIKDANNMGSAMAPAFADTLAAHFKDTGRQPSDYDLILSGDLGKLGKELAIELLKKEGYDISGNYNDCGVMIYDLEEQDMHCGGSGCGCSAAVLCGDILKKIEDGTFNRVLFAATGALMSPEMSKQGESIPSISHAIVFEHA
ncbi:MAG: stage V sporulation protein AD [Bacillota bacterium]|nr:stage V sporulation protein AD [Bacillota bacterium]